MPSSLFLADLFQLLVSVLFFLFVSFLFFLLKTTEASPIAARALESVTTRQDRGDNASSFLFPVHRQGHRRLFSS